MKLAVATGTRADWGLLKPLADELSGKGTDLTVIATNMHLNPLYGRTVEEIRNDGYKPVCLPANGSPARVMADATVAFYEWFDANSCDAVIILGDRFEMLGVASAALMSNIPIVHIAGGTVSEGAFDNSIRNAITQMASLHLVETDKCRERVIGMGIDPDNVITCGALGVYNFINGECIPREKLSESIGLDVTDPTLLVTLHAATLESVSPLSQIRSLTSALSRLIDPTEELLNMAPYIKDCRVIFTYPNNDSDAPAMIGEIERFKTKYPYRVTTVKSLGRVRYLSALRYCAAVAGNSSSGIVEVPSAGIPTLDIGIRQKGRERADSVINCGSSEEEILQGLLTALNPAVRDKARHTVNPYSRPDTPAIMADAITRLKIKR